MNNQIASVLADTAKKMRQKRLKCVIYKLCLQSLYHLRMRHGSAFGHICLSVCLPVRPSVCLSVCLSICNAVMLQLLKDFT